MKNTIVCLMNLFIIFSAVQANAYFELSRNATPRAQSLANAVIAETEDPINGFLQNPALIAYSTSLQFQQIFNMDYTGFDTTTFRTYVASLIVPFTHSFKNEALFKHLVWGFSFNRFMIKEEGSLYDEEDNYSSYDQFMAITLAKKHENLFSYSTILSYGVNLNIFGIGITENVFTANNPDLTALSKWAFGLDAGATYYLNENMVLAAALENLIAPNLARLEGQTSPITRVLKLGMTWNLKNISFMENPKIFFTFAQRKYEDSSDSDSPPKEIHIAYEFWKWEKLFAFRLGYERSMRRKKQGFSNLTTGIGFNKLVSYNHEMQFDFGYKIPVFFNKDIRFGGTFGTYQMALAYKWHLPQSTFEFDDQRRQEQIQIEELQKQYREQEKEEGATFDSLKKDMEASGDAALANLSNPDEILTRANEIRNESLEAFYQKYTETKTRLTGEINTLQSETGSRINDITAQITEKLSDLESATDEASKIALGEEINQLYQQRQDSAEQANREMEDLAGRIEDLNKAGGKHLDAVESQYDHTHKKFRKESSENFTENPPSIPYDELQEDLSQKKYEVQLFEVQKGKAPKSKKSSDDSSAAAPADESASDTPAENGVASVEGENEADNILIAANADRNSALEALNERYSSKRTELIGLIDTARTEAQTEISKLSGQIDEKLLAFEASADQTEKEALVDELNSLYSEREKAALEANKTIESLSDQINDLSKAGLKEFSTIEGDFGKLMKKNQKDASVFTEQAPSIPYDELEAQLNEKKYEAELLEVQKGKAPKI